MNPSFKKSMLLFLAIICCYSLHAQRKRRTCDVQPTIVSPSDTVINGERASLELLFGNHGPDKLITGDAVFLIVYLQENGQQTMIHQNILEGQGNDSLNFDQSLSYTRGFNFGIPDFTQPRTLDFCAQVFSEVLMDSGDSAICAYYDPNKSNDITCKRVTIMPKTTTAIMDADGSGIAFSLYPNPALDKLYIHTAHNRKKSENTIIMIRDITGRMMSTVAYHNDQMAQGPVVIDVAAFPVGGYILSLQTGDELYTKRFSISR